MDTRKFAMNYGAYLGLALIVISFIVYILGLEEQKSIIPSLLNNFLMIGAIVYSVTIYRDNFNNGFISYGESLKLGTSVVFFASVILAFYTFLFVTFINPEYLEKILKVAEQEILNSDPEISDENLDLALSMTQKMLQPQWMITLSVLGGTFMGFFYSLIISFFLKRESENAEDFFNKIGDNETKKTNKTYPNFILIFFGLILCSIVVIFQNFSKSVGGLGGLPTGVFYLVWGLLANFIWKKYKR